jgi:hypothetical protein
MTELQPWQRQPGETDKAWAAFVTFRNLEPSERSLSRVVSELGKSRGLIERWSSRNNWRERAEAWDEEQDLRLLSSRVEAKKRMDEEHLRIVRAARNKAVQALKDVDPSEFTLTELRNWLDMTMKWERLIIGEPETVVERRVKVEAKDYDIEKEMEELWPLIEDMYRRGILTDEEVA